MAEVALFAADLLAPAVFRVDFQAGACGLEMLPAFPAADSTGLLAFPAADSTGLLAFLAVGSAGVRCRDRDLSHRGDLRPGASHAQQETARSRVVSWLRMPLLTEPMLLAV